MSHSNENNPEGFVFIRSANNWSKELFLVLRNRQAWLDTACKNVDAKLVSCELKVHLSEPIPIPSSSRTVKNG